MYDSEKLLVDDITNMLVERSTKVPSLLKGKNQVILTEVNLGYGIADIVLSEYEKDSDYRTDYLSVNDIKILSIVSGHDEFGISVDVIIKRTKNSKKRVDDSISKLATLGFVSLTEGSVYNTNKYRQIVKSSTAIEAKLRNWKRALKQAYRYKWFSERAFVCIPEDNIKPAINSLEIFKQYAVGLISMCPEKGMKVIYNPGPAQPISNDMSMMLNESVLCTLNCFE